MPASHFRVPQTVEEADPRRWIALIVLLLANFMNLMDVTIVNVALPSMQINLGATPSEIEWVVAAYVLAFALGLLPFGRLGDIIGRKKMFLIGVTGFTLGSLLCGISPTITTLIGARALQGFAASAMTPQVLAIAQVTFPPKEKGMMFSFFGLSASLASVCGPVIGGSLIAGNFWGLDWRPIFLVNIPFGILAVAAGAALINNVPPHPGLKNDYVGIGLFGTAVVLLIYPLIEGRGYGWPLWAFGMIAASLVLVAAFYLWQRRRDAMQLAQLLPVQLLHNRNFVLGAAMTIVFASGIPGIFMVLAIFLQSGFGMTPLESGITTIPFSLGVVIASLVAGRLGSLFLSGRVAAGALLLAIGMAYLRYVLSQVGASVDHWSLLAPLMISGIGLGTTFSGLFQTILAGVPPKDAGSGSGALQAFQQVGGALGVALIGEIFFTWLEHAQAWGATSKATAFINAATNATIYEVVVFLAVAAMVPFLKRLPNPQGGEPRRDAPPATAEA
jgi:EmrB/QacA subfamily drug resistance transporter